jgi:alpha-N-arabinofuranosidase
MRDAMLAGVTLNIFNNHADRVRGANLAQAINVLQSVILTKGDKMILTPTYHVMEMYNVHQDAKLLPLTIKSGEFVLNNEKLPAVSASASIDNSGTGHISIVNIDTHQGQEISVTIYGSKFKTVKGRILTSEKVNDHNTFDAPNEIQPQEFKGARFDGGVLKIKIPPVSIIVLELI